MFEFVMQRKVNGEWVTMPGHGYTTLGRAARALASSTPIGLRVAHGNGQPLSRVEEDFVIMVVMGCAG